MAFFVIIGPLSGVARAEDALRTDDPSTVSFLGKSYTRINQTDANNDGTLDAISKLPLSNLKDTDGYQYSDPTADTVSFLLTSGANSAPNATQAIYVTYAYAPPDKYTQPSNPQTVAISTTTSAPGAPSNCDSATTGAVGWIICPMTTFLAKMMDGIYSIISDFLEVRSVTGDTTSSIYRLWTVIRDIANVCFIIALLVMIYSHLTSIGISNYELKKMIPRLIIAAILVNISYLICAAAVDISNMLGRAIHDLFLSMMNTVNQGSGYDNINVPSWQTVSTAVLAGGGIIYGIHMVNMQALYFLVPLLLGVLVAALVALVVLAARQALIVLLIIISPLAFVAFVLPNTEKLFEKWRSSFMTMLLLFPIFSALFSGAQLAGLAIIQNANGSIIILILGMAVQVAPIAITPLLVRFSGGLIGKIAGVVNNPNKGLIDKSRNWANDMASQRRKRLIAQSPSTRKGRFANPGFYSTSVARRADQRRRNREALSSAYDKQAAYNAALSAKGRSAELMTRQIEDNEAERKAKADRHLSELTANHATDGYYGDYASGSTRQKRRGESIAEEMSRNHRTVALDNMARRNAEFKQQENLAKDIETQTVHIDLNNKTSAEYAAGILNVQGRASALANARTTLREQQSKFSAEYDQLRDEYMPSMKEIKNYVAGVSSTLKFTDKAGNVVLEVDRNNSSAMNSMIKQITNIGIVSEVEEMIINSGKNKDLFDFRETVADVLAKRGATSRSIYEGGALIEEIRQGRVASQNDLLEYIQGQIDKGKASAQKVATLDPEAADRFIKAIMMDRRTGMLNDAGARVNATSSNYLNQVAAFLQQADKALTDPQLQGQIADNTRIELLKLQRAYTDLGLRNRYDERNGTFDLTGITLADIRNRIN